MLGKKPKETKEKDIDIIESEMNKIPEISNTNEWMEELEGQLAIDVFQSGDEIVIKAPIAGVKPEDIDISINDDTVTVRGERKKEKETKQEDYYCQECYWGSFSRSVILPVGVAADKAKAVFKDGILTISLPKATSIKVKKLKVRSL